MRLWAALVLALGCAQGWAATAYVTDELVLGVYADQSTEGQRLATLHSGANVETLIVRGDATQVRLEDGTIGWVKTAYLTNNEPAVVQVKQLRDELDRTRTRSLPQSGSAAAAAKQVPQRGLAEILPSAALALERCNTTFAGERLLARSRGIGAPYQI